MLTKRIKLCQLSSSLPPQTYTLPKTNPLQKDTQKHTFNGFHFTKNYLKKKKQEKNHNITFSAFSFHKA